jgi:hypothetical protein
LKGRDNNSGRFIHDLINDSSYQDGRIQVLENTIMELRNDIKSIIQSVGQLYSNLTIASSGLSYDFQNVKSKYGIYN